MISERFLQARPKPMKYQEMINLSTLLLKNGHLIKGTGEEPLCNTDLLIEEGIIKEIKPTGLIPFNQYHTVDIANMTVMPGLINCHVHVTLEPVGDPFSLLNNENRTKAALRAAVNVKKHLQSGVTYLRDMGGYDNIDLEVKSCVEEGFIPGPGMQVSGKALTMTGGHGHRFGRECDGEDDARKAAREQLKAGADIIKLMATGGVLTPGVEPGSPQLTIKEMAAAIEEAHKAGRKTAAHAQGTVGIKNALIAGIDSIEHGIFLDDETIEMMIAQNTYFVPTLVAPYFIIKYGPEGGAPEYAIEKSKRVEEFHTKSFIKALKAGVKIAMGTDSGTPFNLHDGTVQELLLMVKYGMKPLEVITAATKTAAELLGIDNDYGTLEEGKFADLIVLAENPLTDMQTMLDIKYVYKKGVNVNGQ